MILLVAALLALTGTAVGAFTPSPRLEWDLTGEQIAQRCAQAKKRAEMDLVALAALPPEGRSFDNTPAALDNVMFRLADETAAETFLKDVSVSSSSRQAAHACATLLEQFGIEVYSTEALYKAVAAYAQTKPELSGQDQRLLDKTLLDFQRNGLALPEEKRHAARKIKQRLVALEDEFNKNIAEDKSALLATHDELEGLPPDFVARLPRLRDLYKVSVDYPDYFPFMENARNADARMRLEALFDNRAARQNVPLLKEAIALRAEAARLLGYKTHADYVLEPRMAKNAATVDAFIARLVKRLLPLGQRELAELVKLKDAEEGAKSDHQIHAWDWRYYDNQLRKKKYDVDEEKVKDYFPMETVTAGLLGVYQDLLGVRFRKIPDASVWSPDVSLYAITDARTKDVRGYFYMDLFPRDGKYKHAAAFDLVHARLLPDGGYQKPVSAIVANFSKSLPGKPSLLKHGEHGEVETFFHEFGHIMHQTLTTARYGRFSGSNVAQDFVEAPSQMLENWVWSPQVLDRLAGRVDDPSQKLPKDLLDRMIAAKNLDVALKSLRQMLFARVDLDYHTKEVADTTEAWRAVARDVSLIPIATATHPEASFGHIMGGYDAGYYGYMWSKVYAEDMFGKFEEEGLLNPAIGRRYREEILEPGSSREESESLKRFLGREPNEDAFLKSIGLGGKGKS